MAIRKLHNGESSGGHFHTLSQVIHEIRITLHTLRLLMKTTIIKVFSGIPYCFSTVLYKGLPSSTEEPSSILFFLLFLFLLESAVSDERPFCFSTVCSRKPYCFRSVSFSLFFYKFCVHDFSKLLERFT